MNYTCFQGGKGKGGGKLIIVTSKENNCFIVLKKKNGLGYKKVSEFKSKGIIATYTLNPV